MRKAAFLAIASLGLAALLSACGSSGSNSGGDTGITNPVVADGYLRGATVFVDLDGNKVLGASEPWGTTGVGGVTAWEVAPTQAQIDQFPVLADIQPGVIDEDLIVTAADGSEDTSGAAISKRYILSAPAGRADFISPMTTLIHQEIEQHGVSIEVAEAKVKATLGESDGSTLDLFMDYIEGGDQETHRIAQLVAKDQGLSIADIETNFIALGGVDNSTLMGLVHEGVMVRLAGYAMEVKAADVGTFDPQSYQWPGMNMDAESMSQYMGQVAWAAKCASCHGAANEGIANDGPALTTESDFAALDTGEMAGLAVSAAELTAIKGWLPAGKPAVWDAQCAGCHGAANEGFEGDGPALTTESDFARIDQGDMVGLAVSDAELTAIKAWLPAGMPAVWDDQRFFDPAFSTSQLWTCADCHGPNNEGIEGDGPALTADSNFDLIGLGSMKGLYVTDGEIAALKTWFNDHAAPVEAPPIEAPPVDQTPDAIDGASLFATDCGKCHTSSDLTGKTFAAIKTKITTGSHGGGTSFNLSDEEIQAMADAL